MLATKNLAAAILIVLAALLGGCTPPGPRALLAGKRLLEKGHPREAVEKLKEAATLLKTNAIAWDYLGLACHYAGQREEAERAYQRALQCDRDLTEAHYNLGCLWLEQNKLEGAKLELTACTLRRANWAEGQLELGTVQLRLHDLAAAEKSFGEVLRSSPQNAAALNGLGLVRVQRGHPADAAAFFASALKTQPQYAPALLNLAIVSQQYLRDRRLASQKYQEYLALRPAPPDADAVSAVLGRLDLELNPAAHASTNHPAEPTVPKSAPSAAPAEPGSSAVTKPAPAAVLPRPATPTPGVRPEPTAAPPAAGATEPAEPVSKPARDLPLPSVAAKPAQAGIVSNRVAGPRYAYLSPVKPAPGNRTQAQRAFDEGLRAQSANRLPEALQAYRRAVQLDPAFFEADYNLGLVATAARNWPTALAAYENALAIKPDSANARYNFALVLRQANHVADAVNELERLLASHPNETRAHLALANLYAQQLHQPAKARAHYEKVLDLDPGLPQAAAIRDWLDANGG
ncbi:MAG: tetratricopeptide repeat protein [Limisphaerales bacterium]